MPDPSWQAQQQMIQQQVQRIDQNNVRMNRELNDMADRAQALPLVVGVVVLLARNPELRSEAWTFAQRLWEQARAAVEGS